MNKRLLIVDDDRDTCELLELWLKREGYCVTTLTSAIAALETVATQDFDVVLTDLGMHEMSGLELCERIIGTRPNLPVIVITGQSSMESAIAAMRAGAFDFITKPLESKLLSLGVARAMQHGELCEEVKRLRAAAVRSKNESLGESAAMRRVEELIGRVADSDASVLIHGETGTGKELIARSIHNESRRKSGPFVAINCAAVPSALLESELFGHARGAFTDAKSQRNGLFVQANGGTLFLDEIGELPIDVQPKLLRALQERKVRPVGSDIEIGFDARLVAATNRDLEYEVFEKRFREDLYYRINVVKIDVPPLRDRGGDVLHLTTKFLAQFAARTGNEALLLSSSAAEKLLAYDWPGNVRELENCIERAVALARFNQLTIEDLPEKVRGYRANRFVISADDATEIMTMEELERRYIIRVLSLVSGNKSRAAQILGFDRRTLYRKLDRYDQGAPASKPVASAQSA